MSIYNNPSSPLPIEQIKAILFDLDGTLLDTDSLAVARIARRLRPIFGHRAHSISRKLLMKAETPGNALVTLLDIFGLDERMVSLTDKLRRKRGVYPAHQFQLIPGVENLFLPLHNAGYKLGIVTTRSRYHIDHFLKQYPQISTFIAATCGLQDTRRLKPHPSPILLASRKLEVPIEYCLMVGDTVVDVKSARRAGCWSIAVLCGFGERKELEKAGAHAILKSTADLIQFLNDYAD